MSQSQSSDPPETYHTVGGNKGVSRRGFLRIGAAGVGAATVGGASIRVGSERSAALVPLAPFAIAAFAGAAGVAYLGGDVDLDLLGGDDMSGYTGSDALHTAIYEDGIEMMSVDERVMTSIGNNITNSQNVGLAKGKAAIIEAMNAEKSEAEATTAMQDAIDAYYAKIQENILIHYEAQVQQFAHHLTQAVNHDNLNGYDVIEERGQTNSRWLPSDSSTDPDTWDEPTEITSDVDLLDGSTITLDVVETTKSGYDIHSYAWPPSGGEGTVGGSYHVALNAYKDQSGDFTPWNVYRFVEQFNAVSTERDSVNDTLSGFVSDVYGAYNPGDIPTEDLVDPITAATELNQNYDGYQQQGAYAAMLGIPTNAEQSVTITVHQEDGDKTMTVDLYTEHVPTDGDGNEIGFQAGTTYDPSSWSEPLYIAYSFQSDEGESTDFVQLETSFTIDQIRNKDGDIVDSFQNESRNTQTADVDALQEELDQIRQTQIEMQEEAEEDTGGGGGGFLPDLGGNARLLLLGAAGLIGYGLLNNN